MAEKKDTTNPAAKEMPPFNEMATCPKCGSMSIGSKYENLESGAEVIIRTCQRCGYFWPQATLDTKTLDTKL